MIKKYYSKKIEALSKLESDEHLFSEDVGETGAKRFLITKRKNMYELIKNNNNSCFYENIEELDRVKLHFDIDIKVSPSLNYNATYLEDKVKSCIQLYNKLLQNTFNMSSPKIIILDASVETKLSAHIIYTNVHFANMFSLKQFVFLINKEQREQCHIDPAIYRVGCFRMYGNSKAGKNNKLTFKRSYNHKYDDKEQVFMDSLITNICENSFLIDVQPFINTEIKQLKKQHTENFAVKLELTEEQRSELFNEAEKCIKLLNNKRSDNYSDWINIGICLHGIENSQRCFDLFNKFSKQSDLYVNELECSRKWNSFSSKNITRKITIGSLKYMAKKDNPIDYGKIIANKITEYKYTESIKFEQEYMIDIKETILAQSNRNIVCEKLVDFIYNTSIKSLIINSAYNTGKTALLSSIFKEYSNIFKKVLIITYRKSLTSELMHNFDYYDFCSYESGCFFVDKLICQIESLHRIDISDDEDDIPKIPEYDLVIIDEVTSALNHYMSTTVNVPERVFNNMREIIKSAKKLICLDGDIDERCYDFTSDFGKVISLENTIKKNIKNFVFIKNVNTFNAQLSSDLKSGKNIFVVCLSASVAKIYAQLYKDYKTVLYCGDADDSIKKGLHNVENEWIKYQLVIITPCVESGVSFNKPHFYKQYVILSDNSTSQRGLMQMLGRVRQFELNDVSIHLNKLPYYGIEHNFSFTYDEVKEYVKYIKCNKNNIATPQYEILNIHNYVEKANKTKNNFIPHFLRLCNIKGHTYKYDDVKSIKMNQCATISAKDIISTTRLITNDEACRIRNKIIKSNATQIEKQCYEKYMYIKHWKLGALGDVNIKIRADFFKHWYGKTHVIYNLRLLLCKEDSMIPINKDHTGLEIINFKDIEDNAKSKLVVKLLADLGFGNISNKVIEKVDMDINIKKMIMTSEIFNLANSSLLFNKGKNSLQYIKDKYIKDNLDGEYIRYINLNILANYGLVIDISRKKKVVEQERVQYNAYQLKFINNINEYI